MLLSEIRRQQLKLKERQKKTQVGLAGVDLGDQEPDYCKYFLCSNFFFFHVVFERGMIDLFLNRHYSRIG